MADWSKVDPGDVEERERRGGGAASRDLAGSLGAENMTLRVWRYGPGHEMAYHRHKTQEEVYQLLSGGPQEVYVEGETVTVQDGEWLRFAKGTARRIQNHTDREAVWLTIGAPVGAGIRDGIRIDPETGEEIPRT
jgi:quercetin dioxygenase-like cupin family protein